MWSRLLLPRTVSVIREPCRYARFVTGGLLASLATIFLLLAMSCGGNENGATATNAATPSATPTTAAELLPDSDPSPTLTATPASTPPTVTVTEIASSTTPWVTPVPHPTRPPTETAFPLTTLAITAGPFLGAFLTPEEEEWCAEIGAGATATVEMEYTSMTADGEVKTGTQNVPVPLSMTRQLIKDRIDSTRAEG